MTKKNVVLSRFQAKKHPKNGENVSCLLYLPDGADA